MRRHLVAHDIRRVQPQAVDVVLVEPVQRVLDEERMDVFAPLAVQIDAAAPAIIPVRQVLAAELERVVARRAEVVVDDIEQDREAEAVGLIDQSSQIVGPAVSPRGSKQVHAVVAPVPPPGKVRQRHQLDRRHTELAQVLQAVRRARECALLGKGADMELVENAFLGSDPFPALVRPGEGAGVHDLGGAVNSLGLEPAGRVGKRSLAVDAIAVTVPGAHAGHTPGEVAVRRLRKGVHERFAAASLHDDFHLTDLRRPDPKMGPPTLGPGPESGAPGTALCGGNQRGLGHSPTALLISTTTRRDVGPLPVLMANGPGFLPSLL